MDPEKKEIGERIDRSIEWKEQLQERHIEWCMNAPEPIPPEIMKRLAVLEARMAIEDDNIQRLLELLHDDGGRKRPRLSRAESEKPNESKNNTHIDNKHSSMCPALVVNSFLLGLHTLSLLG